VLFLQAETISDFFELGRISSKFKDARILKPEKDVTILCVELKELITELEK